MQNTISEKIQQIKPSATFAISAKANKLRQQGKDIISLGQGEPDFDTPEIIKQAAKDAIKSGFTKYTAIDGIKELKEAIQQKLIKDNALEYQPEQLIVSTGAKQAIFNALTALLNPKDEVIIIAPYWVSYPEMVKLSSGIPKVISTTLENKFKVTPQQLEQTITEKTKLVLLNSPSNPTGMAYTKEELQKLGGVLKQHSQTMIMSDDIYEHILWGKKFDNIATACPFLKDRTIIINGVSKAYAMTGWRIGYAAGPKELIAAMKIVQSQSTSCPNSIAQKAAACAISQPNSIIQDLVNSFKKRHDWLYPQLQKIPGVNPIASDGTFYTFPSIQEIIEKHGFKDDIEFCDQLLDDGGLALVPGSAFGNNQHVRLSFCIGDDILQEAVKRLHTFVGSLD